MGDQRDAGLVRAVGPLGLAASTISMMDRCRHFRGAERAGRFPRTLCATGISRLCRGDRRGRDLLRRGREPHADEWRDLRLCRGGAGSSGRYVAGTLLWVGDVLAVASVAAALADVAASLVPATLITVVRAAVIVGVIGAVAAVNVGGVARGARLVTAATALKLLPLVVFVVVGAAAVHGANFSTPPEIGRAHV